jgi:hypothetical protein
MFLLFPRLVVLHFCDAGGRRLVIYRGFSDYFFLRPWQVRPERAGCLAAELTCLSCQGVGITMTATGLNFCQCSYVFRLNKLVNLGAALKIPLLAESMEHLVVCPFSPEVLWQCGCEYEKCQSSGFISTICETKAKCRWGWGMGTEWSCLLWPSWCPSQLPTCIHKQLVCSSSQYLGGSSQMNAPSASFCSAGLTSHHLDCVPRSVFKSQPVSWAHIDSQAGCLFRGEGSPLEVGDIETMFLLCPAKRFDGKTFLKVVPHRSTSEQARKWKNPFPSVYFLLRIPYLLS